MSYWTTESGEIDVSIPTRGNTLFRGRRRARRAARPGPVSIPTRGNTLFRVWRPVLAPDPAPGVSIHTRGNTLFRAGLSGKGRWRLSWRFNPHSGKHPGPGWDDNGTGYRRPVFFQSPLGETPWSGPSRGRNPSRKRPWRFQSPLGETPWSGVEGDRPAGRWSGDVSIPTRGNTLVRVTPRSPPLKAPGSRFNPHSGKHPGPGPEARANSPLRSGGFNPHSGKHPGPGRAFASAMAKTLQFQSPLGETQWSGGSKAPEGCPVMARVSIPTRGNTLVRYPAAPGNQPVGVVVSIPTRGNTLVRGEILAALATLAGAVFQSPLGETPWSGRPRVEHRPRWSPAVSIPTRGNTLVRTLGLPMSAAACSWFQSPLGETPWSGPTPEDVERRKGWVFQSPLGETPCSGSKSHINNLRRVWVFQSPLGETPCSGEGSGQGAWRRWQAVSIPTRGNTLVRPDENLPFLG